jgi:hypothetical protein
MSDELGSRPSEWTDAEGYLAFRAKYLDQVDTKLLLHFAKDVTKRKWVESLLTEHSLKKKLPSEWFDMGFRCQSLKWAEQSSSWATSIFKSSLLSKSSIVFDLTGGLGIDSMAFASKALEVNYFERDDDLFLQSNANFQVLQLDNIDSKHGNSIELLPKELPKNAVVYLDPDRRGTKGRRSRSLHSMEPNWDEITAIQKRADCEELLVKLSPMHDIQELLDLSLGQGNIHIIEYKGECKEIIWHWKKELKEPSLSIHEIDFKWSTRKMDFSEIAALPKRMTDEIGEYILDLSPSWKKAMTWNKAAEIFSIQKLAANTHLFTSNKVISDFPGRQFVVLGPFDKKRPPLSASVICRNCGSTSAEIKKRLKLKEDPDIFLIAFKNVDDKVNLLLTKKLN